ncbi:NAD(P)H-dependent oxidoreductase [Shimia sp. CNT1-13L.2]|jgi:chromate reductase|uniref:NADPH-dependent FMN reductase n=1 Tax=Shimia sp. CNT1-13L.2 TaxID=2959663 RepID=UPI0020CCE864|nr:NADPH-dependent FMN reductase [Shimia sp. CNT1-13L.2]MCP9483529.1 NAD(P)H-dependent oxidoreductase [Shimia sp. CNT1-13L.2]
MTKLLGLSGALRRESTNRKLLREAARLFGEATYVEADLNMPLYDGDLEEASGLPAAAQTLVQQIAEADAVLISSPEYNSGIPGVLKNALDWASRADVKPWTDKPVALMTAAAGRAGGARAHNNLRLAMAPFRARVVNGPEVMVAASGSQFDEDGRISESYVKNLTALMDTLRAEITR